MVVSGQSAASQRRFLKPLCAFRKEAKVLAVVHESLYGAGWEQVAGMGQGGNAGNGAQAGSLRASTMRGSIMRGSVRGWTKAAQGARWALAVLMLLGCLGTAAKAQSAAAWNKRGQEAETRQDYDVAFEAFRQAHLKKPADLRYRTRYERMRYTAASLHVDRGRVLRQSGDASGAINEFARALQIDPGNETAAQELQVTERPPEGAGAANPAATNGTGPNGANGLNSAAAADHGQPSQSGQGRQGLNSGVAPGAYEQMPRQRAVQQEIASLAAPVELEPVSDDPITLHAVSDTKDIYQAIGKEAGLNVIFDPEYSSKRIQVDLNSVSLYDALRIVGTLSGTFWKPVTTNTIFVAQNTRNKRTDLDDQAVQTFYLTNVSQQNDANEILVAMRNLLDPTVKLYLVNSQNAIVVRATPDQLILAEKLINDLDRTRSEVIVDVAVLEVSRDKLRNLGITLPQSFGLTPTASTTSTTTNNSNGTPAANTPITSQNLTLNSLGNLNATNFAVTVTGGTVNALLSDSDTRILQNPRIRASDGQQATLKIGSRIPVATGSFSSTLSASASLGVQTQFTYIDVGVNIDITPTVHLDREISMKLTVLISSQNGSVTISGVTEPIISQRESKQTIQLKDGEPSILAGLLQQQDTHGTSGTPGLGEIPFLKYFFSTQSREQQSDEIVFLLVPHIVRESLITAENTRPIYTGTSNSVELIRRSPAQMRNARAARGETGASPTSAQPTISAAMAANAMLGELASAAKPRDPGAQPAGPVAAAGNAATASMTPVSLSVSPSSSAPAVGSTFQVSVTATNAHDLFEVPLQLKFDPRVLALVNVDSGDLLGRDGQPVALVHRDEGNGSVTVSAGRPPQTSGVNGAGVVCTLTFKALAVGDSPLSLVKIGAKDSKGTNLPAVGTQGVVHVK